MNELAQTIDFNQEDSPRVERDSRVEGRLDCLNRWVVVNHLDTAV